MGPTPLPNLQRRLQDDEKANQRQETGLAVPLPMSQCQSYSLIASSWQNGQKTGPNAVHRRLVSFFFFLLFNFIFSFVTTGPTPLPNLWRRLRDDEKANQTGKQSPSKFFLSCFMFILLTMF